jgi:hypothetical protein
MPSPSTSLATLRPDLASSMEEYDLEAGRQGFIAQQVLQVLEVDKQAGVFGTIPIEQLLQARDTVRAPGGGYSRGKFTFTTQPYACVEHGAEEPVDDREAEMYRDYFDAELVAARRSRDVVLRNAEGRAAAAVFNTTTWTGASLTTAVGTPWTTIATAVPLTDVETAVKKVYDNSGLVANALVCTWKRFRDLRNVVQIVDRVKYAGFMDPRAGNITAEALAQAFDLKYILVAGGAKNTAKEGQTFVGGSVWTDSNAMICRVAETNDPREPCIGRTMHWAADGSEIGATFETYRDETVRSDVVRARHDVFEKILYVEAGHLLTSV